MADWSTDPSVVRWIHHVLDEMAPAMRDSSVVVSIVPDDKDTVGDVKYWVELGAMICMDKPVIVVAFDGRQIPRKLRLVADEIVVLPEGVSLEGSDELRAAIGRVMGTD